MKTDPLPDPMTEYLMPCLLYTSQVETAKAIQLLAVRIENIERKLEK